MSSPNAKIHSTLQKFVRGQVIWAKLSGYPHWPAVIADEPTREGGKFRVWWLNDDQHSDVRAQEMWDFAPNYDTERRAEANFLLKRGDKAIHMDYLKAVNQAIDLVCNSYGVEDSKRTKYFPETKTFAQMKAAVVTPGFWVVSPHALKIDESLKQASKSAQLPKNDSSPTDEKKTRYNCDGCPETFAGKSELNRHLSERHARQDPITNSPGDKKTESEDHSGKIPSPSSKPSSAGTEAKLKSPSKKSRGVKRGRKSSVADSNRANSNPSTSVKVSKIMAQEAVEAVNTNHAKANSVPKRRSCSRKTSVGAAMNVSNLSEDDEAKFFRMNRARETKTEAGIVDQKLSSRSKNESNESSEIEDETFDQRKQKKSEVKRKISVKPATKRRIRNPSKEPLPDSKEETTSSPTNRESDDSRSSEFFGKSPSDNSDEKTKSKELAHSNERSELESPHSEEQGMWMKVPFGSKMELPLRDAGYAVKNTEPGLAPLPTIYVPPPRTSTSIDPEYVLVNGIPYYPKTAN